MARILLVDDEKGMRESTSILLERMGHQVATATNGTEALALLQAQQFQILITDIIMPQMSGMDLLTETRRIAPDTRVVLITGEPIMAAAITAAQQGAWSYLPKPVTKAELQRVIAEALE